MAPLIVAIDGPSGVGKTTVSKAVAEALEIPHIDTGAMYRAIALKALRSGVATDDEKALEQLSAATTITFSSDGLRRVLLDGEDVSSLIRTPEISMAASKASAAPAVRRRLVAMQQEMGKTLGGVLEGRDIGTKVFPETPDKFFLTARPEVRAERRYLELSAKTQEVDRAAVMADMEQRDRQDSTRADSPLTCDESYTLIDTSDLSIDEVIEKIIGTIRLGGQR